MLTYCANELQNALHSPFVEFGKIVPSRHFQILHDKLPCSAFELMDPAPFFEGLKFSAHCLPRYSRGFGNSRRVDRSITATEFVRSHVGLAYYGQDEHFLQISIKHSRCIAKVFDEELNELILNQPILSARKIDEPRGF